MIRRKGVPGQVPGKETYATSEYEIDELIRNAWDPIRQGNTTDVPKLIADIFNKYDKHIFKAEELDIGDLTAQDLMEECTHASHTAASMDQWHTSEYSLLPIEVFQILADFLNRVEREGSCPEVLAFAKAAFLRKENPENAGPCDLRIHLIFPTCYRRWASCRLRQLQPWTQQWATDEVFSGLPGQGADDASYSFHSHPHRIPRMHGNRFFRRGWGYFLNASTRSSGHWSTNFSRSLACLSASSTLTYPVLRTWTFHRPEIQEKRWKCSAQGFVSTFAGPGFACTKSA